MKPTRSKPERLRAAVEAVSEGLEKMLSEQAWCEYGAQAVGDEDEAAASREATGACALEKVATPTGFEPVLQG